MRAMREDSHPKPPNDPSNFIFRTLACPPDKEEDEKMAPQEVRFKQPN
jgi:hypothetical protein